MEIGLIILWKIFNYCVLTVMLLQTLTVVKIAGNKCVETIYQPPKGFAYGEDIVQTTTQ